MKLRLILVPALLLACALATAQQKSVAYLDASAAFELGEFEKVESILDGKIADMPIEDQIQSYRLLSLSCLYRDMNDKAEKYALDLLSVDPFYSSYGETPRFVDLLTKIRRGNSKVTTASKMAESVEEVPVPVTLITAEMIKASGMTRLQDVLMLYVPGMSQISSLEDNVAMRGVYGLGQETILVLLDGHRLNSSATNSESFDFRNSLEKVKQIEVLRGPASCLYGNYALTAVVNIITKTGADLDGGEVSFSTASYNTHTGTVIFGNGNLKFDYSAWASLYYSEGQAYTENGTTHYVGGYNKKPTFDLGARLRWGDLKFEVTGQQCHPVPYYNILQIENTYTYDDYGTVDGNKPGMSRTNIRADIEWSHSWKKFSLAASAFISSERQQIYNVLGDTVDYYLMAALAKIMGIQTVKTKGLRENISWNDYAMGCSVSAGYEYRIGRKMHGTVMGGLQYENLILGDAQLMIGADYNQTNTVMHNILMDGSEHTISVLAQVKHYFSEKLILNAGVRMDNKIRVGGRVLGTASPRVAIIWMPTNYMTVKGGYSHAFVDAAPFYRVSKISLFSGGNDLSPEQMDSFQASVNFNWKDLGISNETNFFYNDVTDMVFYNLGSTKSTFTNSGRIAMNGVENSFQYKNDRLLTHLNFTYQYPFNVQDYYCTDDKSSLTNVPNFLCNLVVQYAIVSAAKGDKVWIRGNLHGQSSFNCLSNNLVEKIKDPFTIVTYKQPGYVVAGLGAEWESHFGLGVSFDVNNISNTRYDIGGQLYKGVPGLGRSFILKLAYNF